MEQDKTHIYELIDCLRLPLIIGIVYCHTHFYKYLTPESLSQLPITDHVIYICSTLIGCIFTPVFFFISGYLFFRQGTLNKDIYVEKLRRRFHSLLIPYIIWNGLMLGVMFLQEKIMGTTSDRMGTLSEYTSLDFLYAFFDSTQSWSFVGLIGQPANVPLWYLRDLMIMVVASPLFYILAKVNRWLLPCILLAIYCCPYHLPHLNNLSVFWFGMGCWVQMNDIDFVSLSRKVAKWCIPIFCVAAFVNEMIIRADIQLPIDIIVPIMRISEFPILVAFTSWIMTQTTKRIPKSLSKSSFFIYLSHIVPTSALCFLACRVLPLKDVLFSLAYLLIPLIVTLLLICVYLLLTYCMPRTMKVLTGSR